MKNGFKSANPFQCQERNLSFFSVRTPFLPLIVSKDFTALSQRFATTLIALKLGKLPQPAASSKVGFVDESCGLFGWEIGRIEVVTGVKC